MLLLEFNLNLRTTRSDNQIPIQNNMATLKGGFIDSYDLFITIFQQSFYNYSATYVGVFSIPYDTNGI
jgi:hypothetical protein